MKNIKKFNNYIKENYEIESENDEQVGYHIGDLVWAKDMGKKGLVGLVVGELKRDGEDGYLVQDVYLRGYNGETYPIELENLEGIIDGGHLHNAERNGDISAYRSIASDLGIELNPIYQEYIDDENDEENYISDIHESKKIGDEQFHTDYFNNVVKKTLLYLKKSIGKSTSDTEKKFYNNRYDVQLSDFAKALKVSEKEIEKNIDSVKENVNESKKIGITSGQDKDIKKSFPDYDKEKSHIVSEGGNDNGETFKGSFLVQIHKKGVYKFTDGKLDKKVK